MNRYNDNNIEIGKIPLNCLNNEPLMVGIDEAGRGPVLGPMIYSAVYWPIQENENMEKLGFNDSKKLDSERRTKMKDLIKNNTNLGYITHEISAKHISEGMLSKKTNLNEISKNSAIHLIKILLQNKKLNIKKVYIDTVGSTESYLKFMTSHFKLLNYNIEFIIEEKADSKFKIVSAASIIAKVKRDFTLETWKWEEPTLRLPIDTIGSGYPSDPKTKEWLNNNINKIFGYPTIARFSWQTLKSLLDTSACRVIWPNEKEVNKEIPDIRSFLNCTKTPANNNNNDSFKQKRKRIKYFHSKNMERSINDF